MELIQELTQRGLIEGATSDRIADMLKQDTPLSVYCGFDPTADCLHLGHLVPIVGLAWFRKYGHKTVALVGGATGLIGDPSGKSTERVLLGASQLEINVKGVKQVLDSILSRTTGVYDVIHANNQDWFESIGCLEFLRDIGKHFRVGTMVSRESVRARLASEEGLSFTEFAYQLLQAYDFYRLFKNYGVTLQLGGSDQWGNITAGIDFIRRLAGEEAFGMTFPLLLKSDGKKFGKSESGAIWLSESKLSVYDFYQYLLRTSDEDVIKLLKILTFVDLDVIESLQKGMSSSGYVPHTAQKLFADEITKFVHGEEALIRAKEITQRAKPGQIDTVFSKDTGTRTRSDSSG